MRKAEKEQNRNRKETTITHHGIREAKYGRYLSEDITKKTYKSQNG